MKNWNRWLLLAGLLLLPLSAQAKNDDDSGQEKVCFCHNINHNPHTICTANPGLINGHMAHVNGEVPGVQDSLGVCESEPDPSAGPGDDEGDDSDVDHDPPEDDEGNDGEVDEDDPGDDQPGDDDGGADEDHPGEDNTGGDGEPESAPPKDQGALDGAPGTGEVSDAGNGTTGNRGLSSMEGSGCSLNTAAAGAPGGALPWALLATLPLLWTRRR